MKSTLLILLALLCPMAYAEDDRSHQLESEVMETVNLFLHSINTGDVALMAEISRPDAMNFIRVQADDGSFFTRARPQSYFLQESDDVREVTERIWHPTIMVDEQVAVVWAHYDFYIEGEFSHCGIDIFNLLNDDGQWKIANATWTVVRDGCEPSPLGEISE